MCAVRMRNAHSRHGNQDLCKYGFTDLLTNLSFILVRNGELFRFSLSPSLRYVFSRKEQGWSLRHFFNPAARCTGLSTKPKYPEPVTRSGAYGYYQ